VKCPGCNCPLDVPEGRASCVGTCPTCGKAFRATRYAQATQIDLLDRERRPGPAQRSARRKPKGPVPAGRDQAPAALVWTLRLASLAMLAVLPLVAVAEGLARLRNDHSLITAGEVALANVYSPLTYSLAPEDKTLLTYAYEVEGARFQGKVHNDVVRKEPSFQFRVQELKVSETGAAHVEQPEELASLMGVVSVTYSPSDPGYHQIGAVSRHKSWATEIRFLWGVVLAIVGAILARYFFRVQPISRSDGAREPRLL